MKTKLYIQQTYFYMNTETGELLTLKEMIKQAKEEYHITINCFADYLRMKKLFEVTSHSIEEYMNSITKQFLNYEENAIKEH